MDVLDPATVAPLLSSAVQLVMACALLLVAAVRSCVFVRALNTLTAVTLLLALPALHGVGTYSITLPPVTITLAAIFALLSLGLGVLVAVRAVRRRAPFGQSADANIQQRLTRLRGLLRQEHERLETVNQMHRYFELATRNSQITVFYQDKDLTYRWIVNPRIALAPESVVHRSDHDYLPESVRSIVVGHKRRALTTNTTQTFELELPTPDERAWFRVDVVPISEGGSDPIGIVCTAIDITRSKRLDMMRTDLSRRLAETLQRFNLALRSERIMVFSQDLDLRYTWANSDDTQVGSIIGRTDEEVIPEADRNAIITLKRQVIETKTPAVAEVGVGAGPERRWYDLNVEPNLRPDGTVSGITCASIDITHRKRNEEQMHLVLRELTHRTKNLLAVVIAIARQTATQADSVDTFVPALIGRLRALSAAQDLIVADDWAGVYISDLLHVLIGQYVPPQSARVSIDGPPLMLSPEASQNLGLAIHELAANASQHGAFSSTQGCVAVRWEEIANDDGGAMLRLDWSESGGPDVCEPTTRGFGTMVIERNLSRALGAEVDMHYRPSGLHVAITLPLDGVIPFPSPDREQLAKAL